MNTLPVILLIGIVLGFLSGLGIGGGSLLILWLTLVTEIPPETARIINLLFFLPSASIACIIRIRERSLKPAPLLPAIAAGCALAVAGSLMETRMDPENLKKLFGVVLLAAGIREIRYRPRNAR